MSRLYPLQSEGCIPSSPGWMGLVWIFMFNCFLLLSIHFTGPSRSLLLSPVAPDNHCICALFSHRCSNHYGYWLPWQHTVPIPPSRTGRGIKQHELSSPLNTYVLAHLQPFIFVTHTHTHTFIVDLNCFRDIFKNLNFTNLIPGLILQDLSVHVKNCHFYNLAPLLIWLPFSPSPFVFQPQTIFCNLINYNFWVLPEICLFMAVNGLPNPFHVQSTPNWLVISMNCVNQSKQWAASKCVRSAPQGSSTQIAS